MTKPKKKQINFTQDSILALMQEIYNELVEQRSTAIRIQNKMISMMKEPEDMTVIGPVIEKQQNSEETFDISSMDDDILQGLISKDINSDIEKFNL